MAEISASENGEISTKDFKNLSGNTEGRKMSGLEAEAGLFRLVEDFWISEAR